jgi:hypothetical protein
MGKFVNGQTPSPAGKRSRADCLERTGLPTIESRTQSGRSVVVVDLVLIVFVGRR